LAISVSQFIIKNIALNFVVDERLLCLAMMLSVIIMQSILHFTSLQYIASLGFEMVFGREGKGVTFCLAATSRKCPEWQIILGWRNQRKS